MKKIYDTKESAEGESASVAVSERARKEDWRQGRLLLLLLLALGLTLWLFPRDQVADVEFDAAGRVVDLEEEEGRVAVIFCQLEGEEEVRRFPLAAGCRGVSPSGKVSLHNLLGQDVYIHYAEKNAQTKPNLEPEVNIVYVRY